MNPRQLVSNASNQKYPTQSSESPQSSNQPSIVDNFKMDTGSTSTNNLMNNAIVQDDRVVVQDVRGQNRDGNHENVHKTKASSGLGNTSRTRCRFMECYENGDVWMKRIDFNAMAFRLVVDEAPTKQTMFIGKSLSEDSQSRLMPGQSLTRYSIEVYRSCYLCRSLWMSIMRLPALNYSKENLLATFAPQRNLIPEHIFWSIDNNDRKKAKTSVPKPLSALTV
ncbi:hypothetical protein Tco_0989153 [Tanacetum coccineum]|uniref:Ubiquitin-like domain-containing protein n=1 Tax=Tanacetum coccineum TaxID=301880 RepID=A0ABQ5ETB8_9ASTR